MKGLQNIRAGKKVKQFCKDGGSKYTFININWIPKIWGHTKQNYYFRYIPVWWSNQTGEQCHCMESMLHTGWCCTSKEVPGIGCPNCWLSQAIHSDWLKSRQDSITRLAWFWMVVIIEVTLCIRLLSFHVYSKRELKDIRICSNWMYIGCI